MFINTKFCQVI